MPRLSSRSPGYTSSDEDNITGLRRRRLARRRQRRSSSSSPSSLFGSGTSSGYMATGRKRTSSRTSTPCGLRSDVVSTTCRFTRGQVTPSGRRQLASGGLIKPTTVEMYIAFDDEQKVWYLAPVGLPRSTRRDDELSCQHRSENGKAYKTASRGRRTPSENSSIAVLEYAAIEGCREYPPFSSSRDALDSGSHDKDNSYSEMTMSDAARGDTLAAKTDDSGKTSITPPNCASDDTAEKKEPTPSVIRTIVPSSTTVESTSNRDNTGLVTAGADVAERAAVEQGGVGDEIGAALATTLAEKAQIGTAAADKNVIAVVDLPNDRRRTSEIDNKSRLRLVEREQDREIAAAKASNIPHRNDEGGKGGVCWTMSEGSTGKVAVNRLGKESGRPIGSAFAIDDDDGVRAAAVMPARNDGNTEWGSETDRAHQHIAGKSNSRDGADEERVKYPNLRVPYAADCVTNDGESKIRDDASAGIATNRPAFEQATITESAGNLNSATTATIISPTAPNDAVHQWPLKTETAATFTTTTGAKPLPKPASLARSTDFSEERSNTGTRDNPHAEDDPCAKVIGSRIAAGGMSATASLGKTRSQDNRTHSMASWRGQAVSVHGMISVDLVEQYASFLTQSSAERCSVPFRSQQRVSSTEQGQRSIERSDDNRQGVSLTERVSSVDEGAKGQSPSIGRDRQRKVGKGCSHRHRRRSSEDDIENNDRGNHRHKRANATNIEVKQQDSPSSKSEAMPERNSSTPTSSFNTSEKRSRNTPQYGNRSDAFFRRSTRPNFFLAEPYIGPPVVPSFPRAWLKGETFTMSDAEVPDNNLTGSIRCRRRRRCSASNSNSSNSSRSTSSSVLLYASSSSSLEKNSRGNRTRGRQGSTRRHRQPASAEKNGRDGTSASSGSCNGRRGRRRSGLRGGTDSSRSGNYREAKSPPREGGRASTKARTRRPSERANASRSHRAECK